MEFSHEAGDAWGLAHGAVACGRAQLHARLFPRDVAADALPGDCGTFAPCRGAVLHRSIESKAPGQRGRQRTRPDEGTALMTVIPHLDLRPCSRETSALPYQGKRYCRPTWPTWPA